MAYMRDWRANRLDSFNPIRDTRDLVALWRFTELSGSVGQPLAQVRCLAGRGGDLVVDPSSTATPVFGSGTPSGKPTLRTSNAAILSNRNFGVSGDPAWGYPAVMGEFTIAALCKADSSYGLANSGRYAVTSGKRIGIYAGGNDGRLSYGAPTFVVGGGKNLCDDAWHLIVARSTPYWADVWKDGHLVNGGVVGGTLISVGGGVAAGATTITLDTSVASGTVLNVGNPGAENFERVTTSGTPTGSAGAWVTTLATPLVCGHPNGERVISASRSYVGSTMLRGIGVGEFAEVAIWRRILYPDEILAYTVDRFASNEITMDPLAGWPLVQGQWPYAESINDANGQNFVLFDPNRGVTT